MTNRNKNFIHKLFVLILIFFYILAPSLDLKIFVIHMGLVSVALFAMLVRIKVRNFFFVPKSLLVIVIFFIILAIYNFILATLYENNSIYFTSICIKVIVGLVFGWWIASYLFNHGVNSTDLVDQLLMFCTIVGIINSSIIIVEATWPDIKMIIERYLLQNTEGLIYVEHPFMLRGIASAGGAGLSVFNAVTVLFLIYLWSNEKISHTLAVLSAFVITCSNVFIGRTGLILSMLFTAALLLIMLEKYIKFGINGFLKIISTGIIVLILFYLFAGVNLDTATVMWAFEWVYNISSGYIETASSEHLKTMLYLPVDIFHLFFGIGFFEGVDTIYPRTDSGYLKTILSIGLPLSILMYSAIIFLFLKLIKVSHKYFLLVLSVLSVMLVIEVKEPFLYQNFTSRVILLLSGTAMFVLKKHKADSSTKSNFVN